MKLKLPTLPKIFIAKNIQNIIDAALKKQEKICKEFYETKIKNLTDHYESVILDKETNYQEQISVMKKSNDIMRKNALLSQDIRNNTVEFAYKMQNSINNVMDFVMPTLNKMAFDCENYIRKADQHIKKHDVKISINNNKSEKYERKLKTIQENQLALPLVKGVNDGGIEES